MALAGPPESRLVSNSIVQLTPYAFRLVVGLALAAIITRYLGPTHYGEYGLAFAYVALFQTIFSDWGLPTTTLREISAHPERRADLLASAAVLQVLISSASYLLLSGFIVFARDPTLRISTVILGATILLSAMDIWSLGATAELRVGRMLPAGIVGTAALLIFSLVSLRLDWGVIGLVVAATLSVALQYAIVGWLAFFKYGYVARRPNPRHWKFLITESWPIGVTSVFSAILQQAPMIILGLFNLSAAGEFTAAAKVPLQLIMLPLILRTSTFPLLAHSFQNDPKRFRLRLARLLTLTALLGIVIGTAGIGLAPRVVHILFGSRFDAAATAFAWLMVNAAILLPGIVLGEAMIAARMQKVNMIIQAMSLPLLAILLITLIPLFSSAGAAAAVTFAHLFIVAASIFVSRRTPEVSLPLGWLRSAMVAAAAAAIAFLLSRGMNDILSTSLMLVASIGCSFLMERTSVVWMFRRVHASLSFAPNTLR